MHGWTDSRRQQQAQAIRRWRPWDHSTGPRTPAGKARCARNAYRDGVRAKTRQSMREFRELMAQMGALLDAVP
jgi:hypothetical protein